MMKRTFAKGMVAVLVAGVFGAMPAAAWEPTKTVEFIVPAGTGGGADQMARLIQSIIAKHNLMKQSMVVINKGGGAGAEGFLEVKGAKGEPHKIIITLSNLFTTPLATGVPFSWKDLTPVRMMALDQFVLWVPNDAPYKSAAEYIAAVKSGGNNKYKMGGTGSKQEDQIITVALEKVAGAKFTYVPFKGGGDVATQLVGKHVDSSVNNPIEAVAQWRAGNLKPLCVFDDVRMPYKEKITGSMSWNDIPDLQGSRGSHGLPDAARHLHGRRRRPRPGQVLRRPAREGSRDARMEEVHGGWRVQPDDDGRQGIRRLGGQERDAALQPDEGSGLPGSRQVGRAQAGSGRPPGALFSAVKGRGAHAAVA
jgi:tripartite-type tricarboxylate transporter receptor subunit TctC